MSRVEENAVTTFEPYNAFTIRGIRRVVNEGKTGFIIMEHGDVYGVCILLRSLKYSLVIIHVECWD